MFFDPSPKEPEILTISISSTYKCHAILSKRPENHENLATGGNMGLEGEEGELEIREVAPVAATSRILGAKCEEIGASGSPLLDQHSILLSQYSS